MMRHLRFRMRTMFALVTLAAIWYGLSASQVERQRAAVAEIKRLGGHVLYEAAAYDTEPTRLGPWLTAALGPDWLHTVHGVHLPRATDDLVVVLEALPETKKLNLRNFKLTSLGLKHVASLSELESLQFDRGSLDDQCVRSLAKLKRLRHLEIRGAPITDDSMAMISQLPAIQSVFLADCNVTDRGIEAFRGSTTITRLELTGTKITEASASVFSSMPKLEELHLGRSSISDKGLERLANSTELKTPGGCQCDSHKQVMLFPRSAAK